MSLDVGLPLFIGTIVVLTLIVSGSMLFKFRPTRTCHLCGSKVTVDRNRCLVCGYRFERFRGLDL